MWIAGLAMSPHCALMCGPIQALQLRGAPGRAPLFWLHLGRLLGYALLGALAGLVGARLTLWLPAADYGLALQAVAGLVLIWLGLSYLRPAAACHATPLHGAGARATAPRLLARGLVWALLPCGLLYGLLFLAAASGGPGSGALLMAAFGLGTVPLTAAGGRALQRLLGQPQLRRVAASVLIGLGAGSVLLGQLAPILLPWCRAALAAAR